MSKLVGLEVGRGLAACMVVLDHANASTRMFFGAPGNLYVLDYGKFGVDFFFVLSGFVIVWSHWSDIGKPSKLLEYLLKRCIRLYPIAWLVVGSWLIVNMAFGRSPSIEQAVTSLFFVPSLYDPIPTPIWTLRHELLFYVLFSTMIISKTLGTLVLGGWLIACSVQSTLAIMGTPLLGLWAFALSSYHIDFLIGGGIAYLHRHRSFTPSLRPISCGILLLGMVLALTHILNIHRAWLSDYVSFAATGWTLVVGSAFAYVVHGLIVSERAWNFSAWLGLLGASSYSIYISHVPIISVSKCIVFNLPGLETAPILASVLFLVLSCCLGVLLHIVVERRVTAALRHRMIGNRA